MRMCLPRFLWYLATATTSTCAPTSSCTQKRTGNHGIPTRASASAPRGRTNDRPYSPTRLALHPRFSSSAILTIRDSHEASQAPTVLFDMPKLRHHEISTIAARAPLQTALVLWVVQVVQNDTLPQESPQGSSHRACVSRDQPNQLT